MSIYECGSSHESVPNNIKADPSGTGPSCCSVGAPLSTELDRIRLTQLTSKGG